MTDADGRADIESFEMLLQRALAPVDPPEDFGARFESTLQDLTDLAVDELESWELSAMRDPRNWVRPVAAGVVGAGAGTALVVLRVRQQRSRRHAASSNPADLLARTLQAAASEARKLTRR